MTSRPERPHRFLSGLLMAGTLWLILSLTGCQPDPPDVSSQTSLSALVPALPPDHPQSKLQQLEASLKTAWQARAQMKAQEQQARNRFLMELRKLGGETPQLMEKLRGPVKDTDKEFSLKQSYTVWATALAGQALLKEKEDQITRNVKTLRSIMQTRAIHEIQRQVLSEDEQKEVDQIVAGAEVDAELKSLPPVDAEALNRAYSEVNSVIANSGRRLTAVNDLLQLKELPALPVIDVTAEDDSEEIMLRRLKSELLPVGRRASEKLLAAGLAEDALLTDISGLEDVIRYLKAFPREPVWKSQLLRKMEQVIQTEADLIAQPYHMQIKEAAVANDFGTVLDMFELLMEKAPGYSKLDGVKQMVSEHLSVQNALENLDAAAWKLRFDIIMYGPSSAAFQGDHQAGELKIIRVKNQELRFHWCPAGTFRMGSPANESGRDSDENQVTVTLSKGFWMLETEVTQGLWTAVMGGSLDWSDKGQSATHPVYNVSHTEAVAFCEKLTALVRASGELPADWSITLPTEAQWEYAARAGTTTRYYWGDRDADADEYAWHDGNSNDMTHPVGQKKPNAWGLHDMSGNVWEWCADWCADWYVDKLAGGTDPRGPSSASPRVERGGCWRSTVGVGYLRSAGRYWSSPGSRVYDLGFRVACSSVKG